MLSGFSIWVNAGLALFWRMLSRFSTTRWALWMMRSKMASAMANRHQSFRQVKAFEVTYLQEGAKAL